MVDIDRLYEEIGMRVKDARLKADIKQETLADYAGLTRSSIANIESGKQKPSIHILMLIAKCLDIDYTILIPTSDVIKHNHIANKINKKEIVSTTKINGKTEQSLLAFLNTIKK